MAVQTRRRVIVLDTSAFIMDYNPLSVNEKQYTIPQILGELAPNTTPRLRLHIATELGKVELKSPSPNYVRKVEAASSRVGDALHLSEVDKLVLALSLQLKEEGADPVIVTDDYAIHNVADHLGIEYATLTTLGIRYRFRWARYCPACHRRYPGGWTSEVCEVCGTTLKRRVVSRAPARR